VSTLALTLAPARSRTAARVAFQVACAVVGSFLVAGLAQVSIHLGFTPVPITGQTLGVLLIGAAYGPALGAATLGLYLVWAVVGLPVLAANGNGTHDVGWKVLGLASATGGYLLGFVLAAALVGWLSRNGWDRSLRSSVSAMFLGSVVLYAVALPWLHHALPGLVPPGTPVTWDSTMAAGLYPFVIGDILKLLAAAGLLPIAWRFLRRLHPDKEA
jgi:biotin transport system substrate-specific component